ncbi:hypothetical protein QJU87_04265 [Pasteurella skyensis]|uniref:hypothetical protein n=1 Tax=Phocoenobacter skyensis TaxID=97481 RepID=UPI00277170FB|nr:hypothetical protein [Pasteurella skyensis]MDP8189079.1 hypothetical protein [Pasteurella skyensis]
MEISCILKNTLILLFTIPLSAHIVEARSGIFSGFGKEIDSYIQDSANYYRVSKAMLRGLIKMEDGWYNKVSPTGATGVGQFTMKTWNWLASTERGRAIGMLPVTPHNRGTYHDPRYNKRINTLATALYARWHMERFAELGIKITDENLYMAHNIGLDGLYRAILGRSTKEDIKNMRRNGMKNGMSVHDFIVYQKKRYIQHKYEANFKTVIPSYIQTTQSENMNWVDPKQNTMVWIQPKNNKIIWINPK